MKSNFEIGIGSFGKFVSIQLTRFVSTCGYFKIFHLKRNSNLEDEGGGGEQTPQIFR